MIFAWLHQPGEAPHLRRFNGLARRKRLELIAFAEPVMARGLDSPPALPFRAACGHRSGMQVILVITVTLLALAWLTEIETGAIGAMRNGVQVGHDRGRVGAVHDRPIGMHHRGNIERTLIAALYLE